MDFAAILHNRYAVKRFNHEPIPNDQINTLLEWIRLTPSSFNLQPWKIKVVDDYETKECLFPASYGQQQIITCSHVLVFCAEEKVLPLIDKLEVHMKQAGHDPGRIERNVALMHGYFKQYTLEQTLHWAERQVYLALETALLGAKELGFDACPMEGFSATDYSKILQLPEHIHPIVVCALGYPDDTPHEKFRFPIEDILL
jgi:nitroreductase